MVWMMMHGMDVEGASGLVWCPSGFFHLRPVVGRAPLFVEEGYTRVESEKLKSKKTCLFHNDIDGNRVT